MYSAHIHDWGLKVYNIETECAGLGGSTVLLDHIEATSQTSWQKSKKMLFFCQKTHFFGPVTKLNKIFWEKYMSHGPIKILTKIICLNCWYCTSNLAKDVCVRSSEIFSFFKFLVLGPQLFHLAKVYIGSFIDYLYQNRTLRYQAFVIVFQSLKKILFIKS